MKIKLKFWLGLGVFFLVFVGLGGGVGGGGSTCSIWKFPGRIRAVAASLHHDHSNAESEVHLQPTPQLRAMLDP